MPTTLARQQKRWNEIVRDPTLRDLSYKIETNERGQLLLSPRKNEHSFTQTTLLDLLKEHAPAGRRAPEFAIATPKGTKSPDVVWMSDDRWREMEETGDPTTIAPEICVEVMSPANTEDEMSEKATLYFEAGAEEVWIVEEDGHIQFLGQDGDELDQSRIAPDYPSHV